VKKRAIVWPLVVLVVTALALGGCGSDDDEASLTKAQFTRQANAICERSSDERVAEFRARASVKGLSGDQAREEAIVEAFIEPFGEMIEELEDLSPPEGDEQKLEAIFSEMKQGVSEVENDPLVGFEGEEKMFDKANKLASEYGLTSCTV
jgi:hypothetical protein